MLRFSQRYFVVTLGLFVLVSSAACKRRSASQVADVAPTYSVEYRVVNVRSSDTSGSIFEAELKIVPALGEDWKIEFTYPYRVTETYEANIISSGGDRYIAMDPKPENVLTTKGRALTQRFAAYLAEEGKAATSTAPTTSSKTSSETAASNQTEVADKAIGFGEVGTVFRFTAKGRDPGRTPPSNIIVQVKAAVAAPSTDTKVPQSPKVPEAGRAPTGQGPNPAPAADSNAAGDGTPLGAGGECITDNYGYPSAAARASTRSYQTSGSLSALPSLAANASNAELKSFVAQVYDLFPTFKAIYEDDLGLSKQQALAFMYGDMSRESATNHPQSGKLVWYIELETATTPDDNPAHAWGPFQAAVTNFIGGGYDSQILNKTGLPTPNMSDFKNPSVSTFAGMKRLAEGILAAIDYFGPGKNATAYLLGTLAHHNTGWVNASEEKVWRDTYGNEVLRLSQAYQVGSNMNNDVVFWTGQPTSEICR